MVRRAAALVVLGVLLAGCAAAGGGSCPARVREYPVAEQRRVADLLPNLPAPLPEWIEDYGRLRAEVRAYCRGLQR